MSRQDLCLVFLFAVCVRVWLIHVYPGIFGGDSVLRMSNRDQVLLSYQLPLLQIAIFSISRFFDGPLAIRHLMAVIGGIASVGCYRLTTDLTSRSAALLTGLLFASNPFLIELSIVPYQEVLMLAGLLFAFHYYFEEQWTASSIALGLACLTRFEAWAACPVLTLAYGWRHGFRAAEVLKAAAYFCWAPVGWIVWHTGLSNPGTFVIEWPRSSRRLMRYVYLTWITVKNTPVPVLVLAAFGAWRIWRTKAYQDSRLRILGAYVALVVIAIIFSAHGGPPDPERFVTARQASVWITAVILLAAITLRDGGRVVNLLAIAGILIGVAQAYYALRRDTSTAEVQLSYRLAQYLDTALPNGARAVVLTKPVTAETLQLFFDKVRETGGPEGLQKALVMMRGMETTPPDYQRTLIHSKLGKERLVSLAGRIGGAGDVQVPSCIGMAAVWSDFSPSSDVESNFHASLASQAEQIHQIHAGGMSVVVYRLNLPAECVPPR